MKIKKFQMGGPMGEAPMEGGAPGGMPAGEAPMGPEGGQDPIVQLVEMAMQALQSQDPQMALGVCEGLVSLVQGGAEGGGAPAPEGAPMEEPVMARKGTKLVKKGSKMSKKKC